MNTGSIGRTIVPVVEMSTHSLVSGELASFPCLYILHEYLRCSALSCLSMSVSQARDISVVVERTHIAYLRQCTHANIIGNAYSLE
jgi:hypothetical protein